MIILIAGASHTGKTVLAQKLLERYKYPYLSIDHLKMGLIRSGNTDLTPMSNDADLTEYLWPIVREMIRTAIENKQNLIVEGCYIPFDWKKDFSAEYLEHIEYRCLIMSENYIKTHFDDIKYYANVIENRLDDHCALSDLLEENMQNLQEASAHNANCVLIDGSYPADADLMLGDQSMNIWDKLYMAAQKIQNDRTISPFIEAGGVAAAILTKAGNIYFGVCIDTACTLGMCAERNAIANMITNGEHQIDKVVAVMPDGSVGSPCGACREYMMQLDKDSGEIEILLDLETKRTIKLKELIPDWWGNNRFT